MVLKNTVAIVTDSIADIPPEEVDALHITVVPALVTVEGKTYLDGEELSRDEFYRRMPSLSEPATTAAPSPLAFEKVYRRLISSGVERILSIHVASNLSGMLNTVHQAAQAFGDRIHLFDSKQLSLGQGFQAMEAASAARKDMSFESVLETTRIARGRINFIAMINTLEYLKRSGRINWLRAGMGDLLRLKLLVRVADGVIERLGMTRTRSKALSQLLSLANSWGPLKRLAVLHSAIPEEAADVADILRHQSSHPPLVVDVTTALGVHVGPKSIGLVGLSK
jgi:DegV family protein with EDD domain